MSTEIHPAQTTVCPELANPWKDRPLVLLSIWHAQLPSPERSSAEIPSTFASQRYLKAHRRGLTAYRRALVGGWQMVQTRSLAELMLRQRPPLRSVRAQSSSSRQVRRPRLPFEGDRI